VSLLIKILLNFDLIFNENYSNFMTGDGDFMILFSIFHPLISSITILISENSKLYYLKFIFLFKYLMSGINLNLTALV
jgi:hypothetical protein